MSKTPLPSRDHLIRKVATRSLTAPPSLFLVTLGLLLLLSPTVWPTGLLVLAFEAGWVWHCVRDPKFARASSQDMIAGRWREVVDRLEALTGVLDRETGAVLAAIVESQERLQEMGRENSSLLPASRMEILSLIEHCLSLAEKRRRLQSYLATTRAPESQRQAAQLAAKLEKAHDSVTRQLYEEALDQKRQELENFVRVEEAVSRIDGQLAAVQCTFDNLVSKVVRLETAEATTPDTTTDPFYTELHRLTTGIASLEASLNETLSLRGAT